MHFHRFSDDPTGSVWGCLSDDASAVIRPPRAAAFHSAMLQVCSGIQRSSIFVFFPFPISSLDYVFWSKQP